MALGSCIAFGLRALFLARCCVVGNQLGHACSTRHTTAQTRSMESNIFRQGWPGLRFIAAPLSASFSFFLLFGFNDYKTRRGRCAPSGRGARRASRGGAPTAARFVTNRNRKKEKKEKKRCRGRDFWTVFPPEFDCGFNGTIPAPVSALQLEKQPNFGKLQERF